MFQYNFKQYSHSLAWMVVVWIFSFFSNRMMLQKVVWCYLMNCSHMNLFLIKIINDFKWFFRSENDPLWFFNENLPLMISVHTLYQNKSKFACWFAWEDFWHPGLLVSSTGEPSRFHERQTPMIIIKICIFISLVVMLNFHDSK